MYIIDEVHMLSQAAFKAFLKTLEEPPKHAIFILATTEKHKILPTILSRCQIFDFNRISVEDIRKQLEYVAKQEGIEAESDALHVIAQKADGAMRDALSIFDQIVSFCGRNITYQDTIKNLNVLDYEIYFKITDALLAGNYAEALNIFDDVLKKGFEGGYFINGLASHYRDLLVCKDPNTINLIEVGDKTKEKYLQFAQKCSVPFLFNAIQIANSCDMSYRTSQNKRLLVELSLLKICNISSSVFALPQQQAPKPSVAQSQPQPVVSKPVAQEQKPAPAPVAPKPIQPEQPKPQPVSNIPQTDGTKLGLLNKIVGLGGTPNASNAEKTAQVATSVANWGNKEFSSSDVTEAWLAFVAEKCPAGTRWNSYFRNHIPEVDESGAYVLKVEDSAMQIRLAERKEVILNFVRTKLDNGSFNFNFVVDENLVEKNTEVAKTTSERLDELKKNNPEVAGMLSDGDFTQV